MDLGTKNLSEFRRFEENLETTKLACNSLQRCWLDQTAKEVTHDSECDTLLPARLKFASASQLRLLDATQKELSSLFKALKVDYALATGGFFTRGVRFNVFGAENWSRVLKEWRKGDPSFVGCLFYMAPDLALVRKVIPESMDSEMLHKQPEDKDSSTIITETLQIDYKAETKTLSILRKMNEDVFESQISCLLPSGFLPLHFAFHFAKNYSVPLDFKYLQLLVPKKLAEICGGYCLRTHNTFLPEFVSFTFRNKSTQLRMRAVEEAYKLVQFASTLWKECPL